MKYFISTGMNMAVFIVEVYKCGAGGLMHERQFESFMRTF